MAAFPQLALPGSIIKDMIAFVNESGFGAIGTPDMVRAQVDRLWQQSNGGFGVRVRLDQSWPSSTTRR